MARSLFANLERSPILVRVAPFLIFVTLTACQGKFGEESRYWVYVGKTLAGAGMIWAIRPYVREMRWVFSWDAVIAGVAVFGLWVGLNGLYPSADTLLKTGVCPFLDRVGLGEWCAKESTPPAPWNPHIAFGTGLAWLFALARLAGSTLVVPPLEEVFYRSFLYRYLARPDFETLPLKYFAWGPLLISAVIFGFAHHEWLPGILCAVIFQGLIIRHNRLGDAVTAHAIANFLLGVWVVWRGDWHFW